MEWLENRNVKRMNDSQNAAYLLGDDGLFFLTGYRVLENQEKEYLLQCEKVTYNGKIKLVYLSSRFKSFSSLLSRMDADMFMGVLASLLAGVLHVKKNGFLQMENIDLSYDKIFVEPRTLKVYLIYLPIQLDGVMREQYSFENELRTSLIRTIHATPLIHSEETRKLAEELADGTISLEQLYHLVLQEAKGWNNTETQTVKEKERQSPLSLVSIDMPMQIVFDINKPEFVIGKNAELTDGAITYNNAISRRHCKIVYEEHNYFVHDLESANGTYVNGGKVISGFPVPIKKGDRIRLANVEFLVS